MVGKRPIAYQTSVTFFHLSVQSFSVEKVKDELCFKIAKSHVKVLMEKYFWHTGKVRVEQKQEGKKENLFSNEQSMKKISKSTINIKTIRYKKNDYWGFHSIFLEML